MSPSHWTDEHSRLISEAAPPVAATTSTELDRVWARVQEGLPTGGRRRRRRARVLVGTAIAAATLAVGGAAAAGMLSAHTGRYPVDAEDVRLGGPGERLDPAAPDYGDVIRDVTGDIPFPSEEAREISRQYEVRNGQRDAPGTSAVSTGALRFWTARAAVCAWANEWAAAKSEGDSSTEARAAAALDEAPDWPAVTDVDPRQVITYRRTEAADAPIRRRTTERVTDNTEAGYFPLVREAVREGDLTTLGAVLARWGACEPALVPDFTESSPRATR